jgi:hypothetical protein
MLAARQDRGRQAFRFGRGEHKDCVLRWLLERFEKRIEGALAHHVRLVQNVNLVRAAHGLKCDLLAQVTHIVHAVVAGGIDLEDIRVSARDHHFAGFANATRFDDARVITVHRHGDQPRRGRLAHPARATEQVRMANPATLEGGSEHVFDVFLADDLVPMDWSGFLVNRGAHGPILPFTPRRARDGKQCEARQNRWIRDVSSGSDPRDKKVRYQ